MREINNAFKVFFRGRNPTPLKYALKVLKQKKISKFCENCQSQTSRFYQFGHADIDSKYFPFYLQSFATCITIDWQTKKVWHETKSVHSVSFDWRFLDAFLSISKRIFHKTIANKRFYASNKRNYRWELLWRWIGGILQRYKHTNLDVPVLRRASQMKWKLFATWWKVRTNTFLPRLTSLHIEHLRITN